MNDSLPQALWKNFLGSSPEWYKKTIIGFLLLNPLALQLFGPFATGWVLIGEFIFTLALALRCYPLQPGGLLAIEAVLLGMTTPHMVFAETNENSSDNRIFERTPSRMRVNTNSSSSFMK